MVDNRTNLYLSGLISFALFSLFFFSFITMMFTPSKIDTFALKKNDFISISLEVQELKVSSSKKIETVSTPESSEIDTEKNIDINNLFSDVWTKKITKKEEPTKKVNSHRLAEIQKKIKTTQENQVESISEKLTKLDSIKTDTTDNSSSSAEQVNEYLAKIQAIVYQHFHVPQNSEGSSVKTVIELNALGKVIDFRILRYSDNEALNSEADNIAKRLKYVVFPRNPQNRSSRTVVILVSKESN